MIIKLIKFLFSDSLRTFLILSIFHFSLYFSSSNKVFFFLSILTVIALYQHLKKLPLSLFYLYLTTLPFAKGKGLEIILLAKKYVLKNAIFDIDYVFPIFFSTFFLGLFYYIYFKNKNYKKSKSIYISKNTKFSLLAFSLFIFISLLGANTSNFYLPIILSTIQLIQLIFVFFLPFILFNLYKKLTDFYLVISSSLIFQSIWIFLQTLNQGRLNKDVESYLEGFQSGIWSDENFDILRLSGTFYESSILGTFLLGYLAILTWYLLKGKLKDTKEKKIIIFSIVSAFIALVLTGSRAIYLVMIGLILYQLFFLKDQIKNKLKKVNKSVIISLIAIIVLFAMPYLLYRLSSIGKIFFNEGSGNYRIQLTEYAIRLAEKKPLLGVGLNLSPYYLATSFPLEDYFIDPAHPHNIFTQIVTETGLLGLTSFILFLMFIFKPYVHKKRLTKLNGFFFASLTYIFAAQFYPIFINHMEIISYLFLFLGFTAYEGQKLCVKK